MTIIRNGNCGAHGTYFGAACPSCALAVAGVDPRDARIAELEQRVLAWEPVVRAAVAFRKAPAYSEDASSACQTLEDTVDALPPTSIPK